MSILRHQGSPCVRRWVFGLECIRGYCRWLGGIMRRRTSREDKGEFLSDSDIREDAEDWFGHRDLAEVACRAVLNVEPPFNIGVFGSWGTGKTSLINLLRSQLQRAGVCSVTLDAWKYSADDMRRAFLVKVTAEVVPGKVKELQECLYRDVQETSPAEVRLRWGELLSGSSEEWSRVLRGSLGWLGRVLVRFVAPFVVISAVLSAVLWLARGIGVVQSSTPILEAYGNLLLIPLLLAVGSGIADITRNQVLRVSRPRLDSTEEFERFFKDVVKEVKGQRFVVFVDNLDRLADDKMIEALETIKTFLNHPKCIYVVACDDAVVRRAVSRSKRVPGAHAEDPAEGKRDTGEEYLDKFFQLSIRLPPYQAGDIHDFARDQFHKTVLSDDLSNKGINLDRLLSMLLPGAIRSPRKVKKLINEYITLYRTAEQREKSLDHGLRIGMLTDQPLFLAKMVVLRTEFPDFYEDLARNSRMLEYVDRVLVRDRDALEAHQAELCEKYFVTDSGDEETDWSSPRPQHAALVSYLRKTRRITVDDTLPFLSLSQDLVRRELADEHLARVRRCLATDDLEGARELLLAAETDEYFHHLLEFMRESTSSMRGVEQTNAIRVMCGLVNDIPAALRALVSEDLAGLLASQNLDEFAPGDAFGALEYAGAHRTTDEIVQYYVGRLKGAEDDRARAALAACLEHHSLLDRTGQSPRVAGFLAELLQTDLPRALTALEGLRPDEPGIQRLLTGDPRLLESLVLRIDPQNPEQASRVAQVYVRLKDMAPENVRAQCVARVNDLLREPSDPPFADHKRLALSILDQLGPADIPSASTDALGASLLTAIAEVGHEPNKILLWAQALRLRGRLSEGQGQAMDSALSDSVLGRALEHVRALTQLQSLQASEQASSVARGALAPRILDPDRPWEEKASLLECYADTLPSKGDGQLQDLLASMLDSTDVQMVGLAAEAASNYFDRLDRDQQLKLLEKLRERTRSLDPAHKHLTLTPLTSLTTKSDGVGLRNGIGDELLSVMKDGDVSSVQNATRLYSTYRTKLSKNRRATNARDLIHGLERRRAQLGEPFRPLLELAAEESNQVRVGQPASVQFVHLLLSMTQADRPTDQRLLGITSLAKLDSLPASARPEVMEQLETIVNDAASRDAIGDAATELYARFFGRDPKAPPEARSGGEDAPGEEGAEGVEGGGIRIFSGTAGGFSENREGPWSAPVPCNPIHGSWGSLEGAQWVWLRERPTDVDAKTGQTVWHQLTFDIPASPEQLRIGRVQLMVDDVAHLHVNGNLVGEYQGLNRVSEVDIAGHLRRGENLIQMQVDNNNPGSPDSTGTSNPTGIIYLLDVAWSWREESIPGPSVQEDQAG